jgi:hypothetical protein
VITIDDLIEAQMDDLFVVIAPGVMGLIDDSNPSELVIGGVRAVKEGNGSVGAFLDSLPADRRVAVPHVTSDRLAGMLTRRRFREVQRFNPRYGWWESWFVRKPA